MTATAQKKLLITPSGKTFTISPGYENPVSADEMERRRDAWRARNKHLLVGCSTEKYIAQKRREVEAGLE